MSSFYGGVAINSGSGGGSGVGIANIEINNERHLIIYLTDGVKKDLGIIDGATFTPSVVDGILSWANDQGLENPETFDFNSLIQQSGELWVPVNENTGEEQPLDASAYWSHI